MTCLFCQKLFSKHTLKELLICSNWIQKQHEIRTKKYIELFIYFIRL